MKGLKVLRSCGASGKSLAAGTVYAVPADVSEKDAETLVKLGKAEWSEILELAPAAQDPATIEPGAGGRRGGRKGGGSQPSSNG